MGEAVKERGTRRGAERVGDKEEERTPRSPLEESPWARVPLIIIRSNSKRERRKETVRQEEKGRKRREREERRISSLRFDRVGVDRRLIDSPPRHGNFFEEPAGLPFFYNTYHLAQSSFAVFAVPPVPSLVASVFSDRRFDDLTMTYSLHRLTLLQTFRDLALGRWMSISWSVPLIDRLAV